MENLHENVTFILAKDVVAEHELPVKKQKQTIWWEIFYQFQSF